MKSSIHLTILAGLLCTPLLCQQSPWVPDVNLTGKFLVGTYGWSSSYQVLDAQNSVQVLDPYTGTATMLHVVGRPADEAPSAFIIESPTSFLMATKKLTAPASGSIYRVVQARGATWTASRLHQNPLPINANGMVVVGDDLYVVGTSQFGSGFGTYDAHVYRLSTQAGGFATLYRTFGSSSGGAHGIAHSVALVGTDLHVFMFIGADTTVASEHWVIGTVEGTTATKVMDLPLTNRFSSLAAIAAGITTPRTWAPTAAAYDPIVGAIAVASRWGEIVWVTPAGNVVRRAALPGFYTGTEWNDVWVGMALNNDTGAITTGDYAMQLDDYRAEGTPYAQDFAQGIRPVPGIAAISALAYCPSGTRAYFERAGCPDSSGLVPCTYVECLPRSPEPAFALNLTSFGPASVAVLVLGNRMAQGKPFGDTSCLWHVRGNIMLPALINNGVARWPINIPSGIQAKLACQSFVFTPHARAKAYFEFAVSDTRQIVIQ